MSAWSDTGVVLELRPFGDHDAVISLLTAGQGRHAGVVKGARGTRLRGVLQIGNVVYVSWRARLADQLGSFTVEPVDAHVAHILTEPERLAALSSLCATLATTLPEKLHIPGLYEMTRAYIAVLSDPRHVWKAAHIHWEIGTLAALGYGLDLESCAVTGAVEALAYVSPVSGRAVSHHGAVGYEERLLRLPPFLLNRHGAIMTEEDLKHGWQLADYFWLRRVYGELGRTAPAARLRLGRIFGV